jgi:uncharacterized repeat protein (TIGR01451 family)
MKPVCWIRIVAVAIASLVLASCRSITAPIVSTATAVTIMPDDLEPIATTESPLAALASDTGSPSDAPARLHTPESPMPLSAATREVIPATAIDDFQRQSGVVRADLEAPSPALPRFGSPVMPAGFHRPAACGPGCRHGVAACQNGSCPMPMTMAPCEPAIPVVGPYLVCDGGDHGSPAMAIGDAGLANLTAGDTVARFRPADDQRDSEEVRLVASNCACVYAPRFGAVREVSRPLEDSRPVSIGGMTNEQGVNLQVERIPVLRSVQNIAPEGTRKALPGMALQERLGPLAVDQGQPAFEDDGLEGPTERMGIDQVELARRRERLHTAIGFDVPVAWTKIKAANVIVNDTSAQVVAADRGTATLRFESPGRAELTLCKQAGTDTARVGEEIDFTIFMLNSGDRPLTGIVLADALPTRLELVPESAVSNLPADVSTEAGDDGSVVVTWRFTEPLPAGGSGFVRFRALVR